MRAHGRAPSVLAEVGVGGEGGAEERDREQLADLTAREEEILKLLATGESNREIGKRLFISEQTVKNHVASIFRKLQVNDRTKAALLAVKLGLGEKRSG